MMSWNLKQLNCNHKNNISLYACHNLCCRQNSAEEEEIVISGLQKKLL